MVRLVRVWMHPCINSRKSRNFDAQINIRNVEPNSMESGSQRCIETPYRQPGTQGLDDILPKEATPSITSPEAVDEDFGAFGMKV